MDPIVWVALLILVLNIPFGWWREGTRKFSLSWFLAIHVPVPAVVALRLGAGIPFRFTTIPILVAAFFGGQTIGARMRRRRSPRGGIRPGGPRGEGP